MSPPSILTLFCDESGNTGADLFEEKQPFSVTCFVLLNQEQEQTLQVSISEFRRQDTELLGKELKFARLGRTQRGLRVVHAVGEALQEVGARLYFTINEKRYFACHILLETFLDIELNPLVPLESEMPGWRLWLANKVYDSITDAWLKDFIQASRADDVKALQEAGASLARMLRLHPDQRVVESAKLIEAGRKTPFRYGHVEPGMPGLNERFNPASAEFALALRLISQDMASRGEMARVVADVEKQFGAGMNASLELVKLPITDDEHYNYGMPGPATQLLERTEVASHDSLGVQLADIGAGIIGRVVGEAARRVSVERQVLQAWAPFLALTQANPEGQWWRVSENRLGVLQRLFHGASPRLGPR